MKKGQVPFRFATASYLIRISNQRATKLSELQEGLAKCSDSSIFYHTFHSLRRHHFLTEGFSDDFAQWIMAGCNQAALAERLAALDLRDYLSLSDLRNDLRSLVTDFCHSHPERARQEAFEPFYFSEAIEVSVPLNIEVQTLEDFRNVLAELSNASFHFHFVTSRLRLHLRTNDFSLWLSTGLGLESLAQRATRIDIYTNTLEVARRQLLALVSQELER
ncbi:MAG TPA: DUF5752 family protein [Terriglobia bacterium]|nr:DUF5752 family protein [Terriglobia bacterium]